ncbi:MAG: 50S ribosomal protein L1 [Acidobacteria bacterium]|nr:50S ribosomal protein L1 [Acidobacteriota bacterium]
MSKKRKAAVARVDRDRTYPPAEALGLVKEIASASFDETVEAAFMLGIDAKQADQAVRGTVSLPHGTGKSVRVVAFAEGDEAKAAEEAGADLVGAADLVAAIEAGTQALDWDITIAHPSLMADVGKLGRSLGPRGLMPNPKAGTVTQDVGKAVAEFKAGRVEYRNDRYGNVHIAIGKVSFTSDQLVENLSELVAELNRARSSSAKGRYIRRLTVSSTMGVGVPVDVGALEDLDSN